MNHKDMEMDGVGRKVTEALERECTSGNSQVYALRRVEDLLDELAELPDAQRVIAARYHCSLAVTERRKRMAAVP